MPAVGLQDHLQVADVFLGLLEKRAQSLGHIGQLEFVGLAEAFPITPELLGLQSEVRLERPATVGVALD